MIGSTSDDKADKVAVGNVIGEGHANYVLMYNMLTGIRIAVSRCQAKIARALTPDDFNAAHKYSFDMYVDICPSRLRFPVMLMNGKPESATSLRRRPSTTSSSRTTRPSSSAICACGISASTRQITSSVSRPNTSSASWAAQVSPFVLSMFK